MKFLRSLVLLLSLAGLAAPVHAAAQGAALRATGEAELRAAPDGSRIGTLLGGAPVRGGEARSGWREVTLEGWIASRSVRPARGARTDLEVTEEGTLRASPGGAPVLRALGGMRLREVRREGEWVRVQRTGWVRAAALGTAPAPAAAARPAPAAAPAPRQAPPRTAAASPPPAAAPVRAGLVLQKAPGGDTVAVLPGASAAEVVGREGEWTRVRVEGWTRSAVSSAAHPSARAVRESPDAHRGSEVRWTARFIALRHAEAIRTDFTPGEPYVLARDPDGEPGFVYIAVTPEQALAFRRLLPLQEFAFVARVRTGRSPLMGHPVLELVQLRS